MDTDFKRFTGWKYALTAIALFLPWCAVAEIEEQYPPFDAMDVFELEWASDPRVSPDGQSIVYVRRSFEIMSDTGRADLWEVSVAGDFHRPLSAGSGRSTSPSWSPDGTKLAFFRVTAAPHKFTSGGWIPATQPSSQSCSNHRLIWRGHPMVSGWPSPWR